MAQITKWIFLGSTEDAMSIDFIKQNKIKLIISIVEDEELAGFHQDIQQYVLPFNDSPEEQIVPIAEAVYDLIEQNNCTALIHCNTGINASPAVVIYYIMKKFDVSYEKAYGYVKKYKSNIWPCEEYEEQLVEAQIALCDS
jgi:protein-tyrosine phosphatase